MNSRSLFQFSAAMVLGLLSPAQAEIPNNTIKLGVLTDLTGIATDSTGVGSVAAARLAIEDFKTASLTVPVADTAAIRDIKARIDVEHTYIGDLIVTLVPPTGTGVGPITLHDRAGGSTRNLKREYDGLAVPALQSLVGKKPSGSWKLSVADRAAADKGRLKGVALEMRL